MLPGTLSLSCHATAIFLYSLSNPFTTYFIAVCFKHLCHLPRKRLLEGSYETPLTPLHNVSIISLGKLPSDIVTFFELHPTATAITAAVSSTPFSILGTLYASPRHANAFDDATRVSAHQVHSLVSLLSERCSKGPYSRYQDPTWLALVGFRSFQQAFKLGECTTAARYPTRFLTIEIHLDAEEVDEVCREFARGEHHVDKLISQLTVRCGYLSVETSYEYKEELAVPQNPQVSGRISDETVLIPSDANIAIRFDSTCVGLSPSMAGGEESLLRA